MSFTRETPIHEVAVAEGLSPRALSVCRHYYVTTLGDLLSFDPKYLYLLRNCGRKISKELADVIEKYDGLPKYVFDSDDAQTMFNTLPEALELWRRSKPALQVSDVAGFVDAYGVDDFVNIIEKSPATLVEEFDNISSGSHFRYFSQVIEFMNLWNEHIGQRCGHVSQLLGDFIAMLTGHKEVYVSEERFNGLPEVYRQALQEYYSDGFSTLSVRAGNTFRRFSRVGEAIAFVERHVPLERCRIRGCGVVSRAEFSAFLDKFKSEIIPLLSVPDTGSLIAFLNEYMYRQAARDYPFLTDDELHAFVDRRIRGISTPVLSLLVKFVRRSDMQSACAYRLFYGFGKGDTGVSVAEVGAILGISTERVRQLVMKRLPLPPKLLEDVKGVFDFIDSPVMADYLDVWHNVIERDGLDIDARRLMALVCAIDDSYTVVSLAPDAHSYLVKKELLKNVRPMSTLRELLKRYALRKTRDDVFSITPYVRLSRPKSMFHPHLSLIYPIFMDYMSSLDGVTCPNSITIVLASNKLSAEDCIVTLLEEHGSSMSYRQIVDEFVKRYPEFKLNKAATLRSYILRSDRILPVGRSGRYVLSTWKDIFTGSLTEFMIRCLRESDVPLSLGELYRKALVYFPDTTKKSLATLIYLDKGKNFVTLGVLLYGLKGKEYHDFSPELSRSVTRMPFNSRFKQVKEFVRINKRMPMNFSAVESTLWHWIENVEAGNISYTPEQWTEFSEFRRQNARLPQSVGELRFLKNCGKVRDIVEATGKLPLIHENQFEYTWFNRNCRIYGSVSSDVDADELPDNRSRFFADLLLYLAQKGIVIH